MNLRKSVAPPARFDEENYSIQYRPMKPSLTLPRRKKTQPAFPELLSQATKVESLDFAPAAFPSKPLVCESTSTVKQGSVTQRNDYSQLDETDRTEDLDVEEPVLDASIEQMRTSPPRPQHGNASRPLVLWSALEPGLQLYIFEYLATTLGSIDITARTLGLNNRELANLVHLRNVRSIHSTDVEQLWVQCSILGTTGGSYIDPAILSKYLHCFAFAANFDCAGGVQRHLAILFLKQRGIEGQIIDALLQDDSGMWIRPDDEDRPEDYLETAGIHEPVNENNDLWLTQSGLLSDDIHKSHDLGAVTSWFKCAYFPQSIRKALLCMDVEELDGTQRVFIYGSRLNRPRLDLQVEAETGEPNGDLLQDLRSRDISSTLDNHALQHLTLSIKTAKHVLGGHVPTQAIALQGKLTVVVLYALHRTAVQEAFLANLARKSTTLHLNMQEKAHVLETAKQKSLAVLIRALTTRLAQESDMLKDLLSIDASANGGINQNIVASPSSDDASSSTESFPSVQSVSPVEGPDMSFFELDPEGHAILANKFLSDPNKNRPRSDTLSTDATLLLERPQFKWRSAVAPARTLSHRASQYQRPRSPSPPPLSPISDDEDLLDVEVVHPEGFVLAQVPESMKHLLPRNTPWRFAPIPGITHRPQPESRRNPVSGKFSPDSPPISAQDSSIPWTRQSSVPFSETHVPRSLHLGLATDKTESAFRKLIQAATAAAENGPPEASGGSDARLVNRNNETAATSTMDASNPPPLPKPSASTVPLKSPAKSLAKALTPIPQTPPNRPVRPTSAGSSRPQTKKQRERTQPAKSSKASRPASERPTPALLSKLQPKPEGRPKTPRSDKGKPRKPYMTKKRRAELVAAAEAEAEENQESRKRLKIDFSTQNSSSENELREGTPGKVITGPVAIPIPTSEQEENQIMEKAGEHLE